MILNKLFISHQLTFDNQKVQNVSSALIREEARLPAVSSSILFEIFPFIMVFGEDMVIQSIGRSLDQVKLFSKKCPKLESHDISCSVSDFAKLGWQENHGIFRHSSSDN